MIGIILSDGHLQKRYIKGNVRLKYVQSIKHEEYFNFVFDLFKDYTTKTFSPYYISQKHSI